MAKTMKREELGPFMKAVTDQFESELKALGPSLKKKTREDMTAGFKDGFRSALQCLQRDGYLDVDASNAPGAATETSKTG